MKVVVTGVSGRMGQMLLGAVRDTPTARLSGALERPGHDWIGRDVDGVPVTDDIAECLQGGDVVIDFTAPQATCAMAAAAAEQGVAHIIGTTGLSDADIAAIDAAATKTAIVRTGNMSLGVNLLTQLVRQVAAALDDSYDIEVVESHHRHKVDAPSGTALMLGEAAAAGRGVALDQVANRGRDGITGARKPGDIGFAAIRGGDIIGSHDVLFAGAGESITLRHVATDRALFSKGALKAAQWAVGQPPGHYDMLDVLGLRQI